MPHSCQQCAAFAARSPSGAARPHPAARSAFRVRSVHSALAAGCLRLIGWHRLERLLASIPDSNDDFGLT
ncbi:hypothetical protein ACVBGC_32195 [Burkholderia stagnalis]